MDYGLPILAVQDGQGVPQFDTQDRRGELQSTVMDVGRGGQVDDGVKVQADSRALSQMQGGEIPPLPPSAAFDTFDDLYDFLQTFHRNNGAAIVKKSSSRKRQPNGELRITNCTFVCDRGPRRASTSAGIRRPSTQKLDCPVQITASATKKTNGKWVYRVDRGQHNHQKSLDPSAHNIHRRRTMGQQELEKLLLNHKSLTARDMGSILRQASTPATSYFRQRDIYNDRQKIRYKALGGRAAIAEDKSNLTPDPQATGCLDRQLGVGSTDG